MQRRKTWKRKMLQREQGWQIGGKHEQGAQTREEPDESAHVCEEEATFQNEIECSGCNIPERRRSSPSICSESR